MAASLDEILLEDEKESFAHLEFYQNNLDALMGISLRKIPFPFLNRIAVMFNSTRGGDAAWMTFMNELGIYDNVYIIWIEETAKSYKELPIYWALRGPLQHKKTFGQVINALIALERHDVLTDIKPLVEGLLDNNSNSELKSSLYSDFIQPTAPTCDEDITDGKTEVRYANSVGCQLEKNDLQKSEINNSVYQKSVVQNIHEDNKTIKRKLVISVLLLHAVEDEDIARRLSSLLKREGILVRLLSEWVEICLVNSPETIHELLSSDFVIPIVSESFLRDIHPNRFASSQRNVLPLQEDNLSNSTNNHYIYQLLLDEYMKNRCLNFHVRPVMVPNMKRHRLKYDILLTCSLKLWDSVPKLIEILKKTKLMLGS